MSHPIASAKIPETPGVEQLDAAPEDSTPFLAPYYADEWERLATDAKALRPRSRYLIAPYGDAPGVFGIYRRAAK